MKLLTTHANKSNGSYSDVKPVQETIDMAMDNTLEANPPPGKLSPLILYSLCDNNIYSDLAMHQPVQNPQVTIEDWPDPLADYWPRPVGDDPADSDTSDIGDEPIDELEGDPEYIERTTPPRLDPLDEPLLTDGKMRHLLENELGDLANLEWVDMCKY